MRRQLSERTDAIARATDGRFGSVAGTHHKKVKPGAKAPRKKATDVEKSRSGLRAAVAAFKADPSDANRAAVKTASEGFAKSLGSQTPKPVRDTQKRTPKQLEQDRAAVVDTKFKATQKALAEGKHDEVRTSLRSRIQQAIPGIAPRHELDSDKVHLTSQHAAAPELSPGGAMTIPQSLTRQVAAGNWDATKTLVHEEIHGHGPALGAEHFGGKAGHALEEAVTERLARHVMATQPGSDTDDRDVFVRGASKTEARSKVSAPYQDIVEGARAAFKAGGSKDPDADFLVVAKAFKSQKAVSGNYVDAFAKIATKTTALPKPEKLVEALNKLSVYG